MPYYDIRAVIEDKISSGKDFSLFELRCLAESLKNIFVKELVQLYPFPKPVMKVLRKALRDFQAQNQHAPINLDIHNTLFDGQRERVEQYLKKNFQEESAEGLIERVEFFIAESLKNTEVCDELIIAEKERVKKRAGAGAEQSLEEIKSDFQEYLEHLKQLRFSRSTYAWGILELLFNRLQKITLPADFQIARLALMLALDDSRTAYDGIADKFIPGKNYSCLKGLEERLLDHHLDLAPSPPPSVHSQIISELFSPYIMSLKDESGLHIKFWITDEFYSVYCRAAGYSYQVRQTEFFEWVDRVTIESKQELKIKYLDFLQQDKAFSETRRSFEEARLNTIIRTLDDKCAPCHFYEANGFMNFLIEQNAIMKIEHQEEGLVHDGLERTDEDIINMMAQQEVNLGKAHLITIFSIISLHELRHVAASNLLSLTQQNFVPVSHEERTIAVEALRTLYISFNALIYQHTPYHDFYYTLELENDLLRAQSLRKMICTEELFIHFLKEKKSMLRREICEQYAIACVKAGYRRALIVLIQELSVSPDLQCLQERKTLIEFACEQSDLETVKVLLSLHASATTHQTAAYDFFGDRSSQPIEIAYRNRDLPIMQELIAANVSLELKDYDGMTFLMRAILWSDISLIDFLINNGANLTAVDDMGRNILHIALSDAFYDGVLCRASVDLKKDIIDVITFLISVLAERDLLHSLINMRDYSQKTPLMVAVQHDHAGVIECLVQAGADLHKKCENGQNLLMLAVHHVAYEVIHSLSKRNDILITAVDDDNKNAIFIAAEERNLRLVDFLMKHPRTLALQPEEFNNLVFSLWLQAWSYDGAQSFQGMQFFISYLSENYISIINEIDPKKIQTFDAIAKSYKIMNFQHFVEIFGLMPELLKEQQLAGMPLSEYLNVAVSKGKGFEELMPLLEIIYSLIPAKDFERHLSEASIVLQQHNALDAAIKFATYTQRRIMEQQLLELLDSLPKERQATLLEIEGATNSLIEKLEMAEYMNWPVAVFSIVMNDKVITEWPHSKKATAVLVTLVEKSLERIQENPDIDERWSAILQSSLDVFLGFGAFSCMSLNQIIIGSTNQNMITLQIIYQVLSIKAQLCHRQGSHFSLNKINIIASMLFQYFERHQHADLLEKDKSALEKIIFILMEHMSAQKISMEKIKGLLLASSTRINVFISPAVVKFSIQSFYSLLKIFAERTAPSHKLYGLHQSQLLQLKSTLTAESNSEITLAIEALTFQGLLEQQTALALENFSGDLDEAAQRVLNSFAQQYGLQTSWLIGIIILIRNEFLYCSLTNVMAKNLLQRVNSKALHAIEHLYSTQRIPANEEANVKMMLEMYHSTISEYLVLQQTQDEKSLKDFNKAASLYCQIISKQEMTEVVFGPEFIALAKTYTRAASATLKTPDLKKELIASVKIGFRLLSSSGFQVKCLLPAIRDLLECVSAQDFCDEADRTLLEAIYSSNQAHWFFLIEQHIQEDNRNAYIMSYAYKRLSGLAETSMDDTIKPLLLSSPSASVSTTRCNAMLDNHEHKSSSSSQKQKASTRELENDSSLNKRRKHNK